MRAAAQGEEREPFERAVRAEYGCFLDALFGVHEQLRYSPAGWDGSIVAWSPNEEESESRWAGITHVLSRHDIVRAFHAQLSQNGCSADVFVTMFKDVPSNETLRQFTDELEAVWKREGDSLTWFAVERRFFVCVAARASVAAEISKHYETQLRHALDLNRIDFRNAASANTPMVM